MIKKAVILGAGSFAREVLDVFDACNEVSPKKYDVLGFIVDTIYGTPGTIINDKPILGDLSWFRTQPDEVFAVCGVASPEIRRRMIEEAKKQGIKFLSVIHPTAILTRWIQLGEGVVVTAGCIFMNQIAVGDHVHINLGCTIGHDVVIEDFVTLAPGVHISGKVKLKQGCYIGTGANMIQNLNIGEWSIVGAGSTIIRDVPANSTTVGNPGKVIKHREVGWYLENKL